MKKIITNLALGALLLAFTFSVHAQENFFQGKSIRVIREGQPGDLYDLWTRHANDSKGFHQRPKRTNCTGSNLPYEKKPSHL
jgi:hypothetical protein